MTITLAHVSGLINGSISDSVVSNLQWPTTMLKNAVITTKHEVRSFEYFCDTMLIRLSIYYNETKEERRCLDMTAKV